MNPHNSYDVAIIGGGLAGLSLSIQLARAGYSVILAEKEQYPFHRVCGEYVSKESWDFLKGLGVALDQMQLPQIRKLQVSGVSGKLLQQDLPLGGFGISRFLLDHTLARLALDAGVTLKENCKIQDTVFKGDQFIISDGRHEWQAKVACGCFGKRSNLDIKWKRPFANAASSKLNNYIGVKYHVRLPFANDTIALHTFRNGYCGLVKVESDLYNLCYLTTAANLQDSKGSIATMEKTILSQNPWLKKILDGLQTTPPVTISQISFDKKKQVENHVLMVGDAAGMITPLCGNGMSMALHASKLAAQQVSKFLEGAISRDNMEAGYSGQWQKQFAGRLRMGRNIQRLFGYPSLTNMLIGTGNLFPPMIKWMIRQTHGSPF